MTGRRESRFQHPRKRRTRRWQPRRPRQTVSDRGPLVRAPSPCARTGPSATRRSNQKKQPEEANLKGGLQTRRVPGSVLRGCCVLALREAVTRRLLSTTCSGSVEQFHRAVFARAGRGLRGLAQVIKHEIAGPAFSLSLTKVHSLRHRLVRSRQYA